MTNKKRRRRDPGAVIICSLLLIFIAFCSSCSFASTTQQPVLTTTSAPAETLSYAGHPLPTWTAGKFNAALLEARGGVSPYTWTLKEDSKLPEGFMLYTDGKFTGTPPPLPAGTTEYITPSFTIILADSAGQQLAIELNVTIIQPAAPALENASDNNT